jgi:hypothetical protein
VIIGGSDGGISAGLRGREVDPVDVTMVVADALPSRGQVCATTRLWRPASRH